MSSLHGRQVRTRDGGLEHLSPRPPAEGGWTGEQGPPSGSSWHCLLCDWLTCSAPVPHLPACGVQQAQVSGVVFTSHPPSHYPKRRVIPAATLAEPTGPRGAHPLLLALRALRISSADSAEETAPHPLIPFDKASVLLRCGIRGPARTSGKLEPRTPGRTASGPAPALRERSPAFLWRVRSASSYFSCLWPPRRDGPTDTSILNPSDKGRDPSCPPSFGARACQS